jgi:serine/threonine-protein kinase ATR
MDRARYSSMPEEPKQSEGQQHELLSALGKLACAGAHCLDTNSTSRDWRTLYCTLCDTSSVSVRKSAMYWNNRNYGDDWKNAVAGIVAIIREHKFQHSSKSRVLMATAIGRVYNHISETDYLSLENCEAGQWLLGSLSRSLRELKIAAT